MLKLFRQRKLMVRIMFWVIVLIVGVMMVVTLVPGLSQADLSLRDPQGVLARVGEASVTQDAVQREYQRRAQQLGGDPSQFRKFLLQGIVEDLITREVVEYEAGRLGFRVSPEEVALQLQQNSLFYPGGQFVGAQTYEQIVRTQLGMSVPAFEREVERQVLLTKLALWVTGGVSVSPAEVEQEYRRRTETAKIEFVVFGPEEYARRVTPSAEELQSYYQANRARYQLPERRVVRLVPIDRDQLSRRVTVSEQELEEYYQGRRESYRIPERVRVRHILFLRSVESAAAGQPAPGSSEAAPDEARQQAEAVLAQLRRGAGFDALAKEHSADTATREKGGEIGWIQRGQTVPALEQVIFSLPSGSPPELVETSYGVHIVQVLEHQQERLRPLAEVRAEIEPGLKQQKVEQEAFAQARKIVTAVRAGQTLEAAAQAAGWPVVESPPFTREQALPALGAERDFQEAAFRLPAATAGQPTAPVSDPVALPAGYTVLQLKEVSPAHQATFDEVRARVMQAYQQERGTDQAREAAQHLASQVAVGSDLRAAARSSGIEVQTAEPFGRLGAIPGLGAVRDVAPLAFSLPVGTISPAVTVGGKWVVFRVVARTEADLSQMSPGEKEALTNFLLEQKRLLTWRIFTESTRKKLLADGKLRLNQAAIDRLIGAS
ncbi:MAG TPA: peptidyl-prolyl cis-trans isomerase [Candidatus Acidoferrales bacterium]|nr:peptidyl-prolyl cis-trans isomerase [Candidatus Acidoferrales bacterium]